MTRRRDGCRGNLIKFFILHFALCILFPAASPPCPGNISFAFSYNFSGGFSMRISKVVFIKNALILTVSSLIIRFIGMFFRIWLAGAVGSEGMGLYTQIFSFYVLASAFASAGINTAVTRLVSEELANGNTKGVRKILTKCIVVTLFVALFSTIIIYFGADFISERLIGDPRATESI